MQSEAEIDVEVLRSIRHLLTTVAAAAELIKMRRAEDGMDEACERVRVAALELETRLAEMGFTFDGTLLT